MTFICSKHFVDGKGPTEKFPDPVPATATTPQEREKFERGCRKAPFPRSMSTPCKRKRLVFDDSSEISAAEALLNMSMIQMGDSSIVPALPKSKNKVDVGIQTEPVLVLPVDAQLKQDAVTQTVYEKYEL
ncbi:uncharacterized protein LOC141905755 isoform X2 [Tubulanus polymorphus]|uniref:uncharacterized protein LOC141905755 isoform X2 n=1 Tax=Tubulanus polymorphus TaxID=672921 RepID=UPI003DA3707A